MSVRAPQRPSGDFMKLLVTLFLTPAPFEIAVGAAKRESYDFRRIIIILATLVSIALILLVLRGRSWWWYPQIVIGFYVLIVGVALAAVGVAATVWDTDVRELTKWSRGVEVTVTALAPTLGILLVVAGVYLIRDRRRRARAELDTPLPDRIDMAKTRALQHHTAAIWVSDDASMARGREELIRLCLEAIDVRDLHYVAFYPRHGECDFYVDLFEDDAMALKATGDTSARRANYVRHARHVRHLMTKLGARLSDLETGQLVRVVLDVEKGAIFYYNLGNQGFLVGVTLDQHEVDPTDWKMSVLANRVLRAFGQQEDDDFFRYCGHCGRTSRDAPKPPLPGALGATILPLPRKNGAG